MEKFQTSDIPKSPRIQKLVDALYAHMPVIESARAKLITESYKETEGEPIITRRAKAFAHILHNIPIVIRDNELIVGSSTIAPRGCQTFPEFSYEWLEAELDTVATRTADPFYIAEETKAELREADKYWKGKTTSELATSYMAPEAIRAIEHNIFTPGNYFYNGVGHVTVKYWEVLEIGFEGIMAKAQAELDGCNVGDGMIDGCGVGGVFQSPSPEQIYNIAKEVEAGAGVLYLYGNYTGDIMTFDMATDLCDMDDIECRSIVGADDVNSHKDPATRRGVAGIYFMFKAAGARADEGGSLNEVLAAAQLAKDNTRTVGFALTPCIIPEVGHANFELKENEMAMGMGIHGEPGVWNGPLKTSREIAEESLNTLLTDMPVADCEEVSILINGLGATSIEELYILSNDVTQILNSKGIKIYKTIVGEYATSMEMAGASISICKMNDELKKYMDHPVNTPFICQK